MPYAEEEDVIVVGLVDLAAFADVVVPGRAFIGNASTFAMARNFALKPFCLTNGPGFWAGSLAMGREMAIVIVIGDGRVKVLNRRPPPFFRSTYTWA